MQEPVTQNFSDANIVHICKHKGDGANCDKHRDISLLSVAGKNIALVILNLTPALWKPSSLSLSMDFGLDGHLDMFFTLSGKVPGVKLWSLYGIHQLS